MSLTNTPPDIGGNIFYRGIVEKPSDLPQTSAVVGDTYIVREDNGTYLYTENNWNKIDTLLPTDRNRMEEYEVSIARNNIDKLNKLADHFKRCERV